MKDIKIEKLILLTTILFGLILFIDYVFGISNLIHIYNSDIDRFEEMVLKRDIFIHLYSVGLIPILGFYGMINRHRIKENEEPDVLLYSIQPLFTFIFGYYFFKLFNILCFSVTTDIKIITTILFQYVFLLTISDIFSKALKKIINKWNKL